MFKVVLIGDSIRMGYQDRVRQIVGARAEVVAPDANCGNTMLVRENLGPWVIDRAPDLVHFNCGIHDLGWMAGEKVPRFTIGAYVRNLRIIVSRMKESTRARLIFATTTPFLIPCIAEVPKAKCRSAAIVGRYNAAAARLMRRLGVPVNDLNRVVVRAGLHACLSDDKIHMTAEGNEILAQAVAAAILHELRDARTVR